MALNETLFGFLGNGFERNQFWIFSEVGAEWNQFRIFPMVGFERNLFWFSILPVPVWQRWRPAISWLRLEQPRWSARTGRPLYPPYTKSAFFKVTQEFFLQFSDCFFYHLSGCFFIFPDLFIIFRFLFIIFPVIFLILFPVFFIIFPVVFLKLIHQENGLNALCFMSTNNMFQLSHFKNN